jgi:dipeptidyl aminopeptidase/acylaminoacyl peptidase
MRDAMNPLCHPVRTLAVMLALCVPPAATLAQTPSAAASVAKRLSFEDILRWKLPSKPVISPDGQRIAFLLTENEMEPSRVLVHLWWVHSETRQVRRLTHLDEVVAAPRWSPDGRWLGFVSGRGVDGKQKPQVWLLPVDGGEAFPLTRAPEGVLYWNWSGDGKAVFYVTHEAASTATASLREKLQREKKDTVVVEEEKLRQEIWRTSVESQEAERLSAGDFGLDEIYPSPDGKWLIYRANGTGDPDHDTRNNLWLFDAATRKARPLVERVGLERSIVWSADSTRVAFLAPREAALRYSQEEIFLMPVAWTGTRPEPQRLTRDFAGSIEGLRWPRGSAIFFAAEIRTGSRLFQVDTTDGIVRPASGETHYLSALDCTPDGAACAGLLETSATLPEIAVIRQAAGAEPQKLSDLNPQLKEFALGAQEVVRWKSKDGREIEGVLLRPVAGDPLKKQPLLLDIHGGPYGRRGNTLTTGNLSQAWAARGWLVLQPNFRGSSGYGHEFGLGSRGDIGGRDYEDIMSGVDYIIAQGWADPERMAVMGESYGGYMTNWIIGHGQRFRAAVSAFGLFSLLTDFSNSAYPSWENDYLGKFYWQDLPLFMDRSPQKFVQQMQTPALILHGEADENTFIANSQEMYQALKLLGRTVRFVRFPREGHGFIEPQHVLARFRETAAWIERHVPGFDEGGTLVSGDRVHQGGWELRVAEVLASDSLAGVKPHGRWLEVAIVLRAVEPTGGRTSILVFDNAGGEVSLLGSGRVFYPEGLVSETLGEKLLVKAGGGQVLAAVPDKDGRHTTLAFRVAFDLPADVREVVLKLKEFPGLRVTVPVRK